MSHKDAPQETLSQVACREWWQRAQPHVSRAWGQAKSGAFLAEETRLLHESWCAAAHLTRPTLTARSSEALEQVRDWLLARANDGQMQRSVYVSDYQLREMADTITARLTQPMRSVSDEAVARAVSDIFPAMSAHPSDFSRVRAALTHFAAIAQEKQS
jgi:hypothetical protein